MIDKLSTLNSAQGVMAPSRVDSTKAAAAPEAAPKSPARQPAMDAYIPAEKQEPSGRYWMGKDEDGSPKIYFDDPEKAGKEERWVCDTDKVDREIEQLKSKAQEMENRLATETDETKIKDLERQLAQAQRELEQKDNDTYRKQHSSFTQQS